MLALHDRTRRFWTFVLFLTGGPLMTLIVLGGLWLRNGSWAVRSEEESLLARLSVPVNLEDVRYLRPAERVLLGLGLQDPKFNQTTLYCPVVSLVERQGTAKRKDFDTHPAAKLAKIHNLNKHDIWVKATIPQVYVRYSAIPRIKFLLNEFLQQTTDLTGQRIVLFEIGEIVVCYSDADFQQKCEQDHELSRAEKRNQAESLLAMTSNEKGTDFETVDASAESVQRWIKKYNEQTLGAKLTDAIGFYQATQSVRRLELEFRFAPIPAENPVSFSWEFQRKEGSKTEGVSRAVLKSVKSQFPCSFASMFCPFFFIVGTESWMTGTITAEITCSDASPGKTVYRFDDFHLKYCDLAPLAKRVTTRIVSGTVADFHLESAQVQQGVFTGKGLLFLVDGSLEKKFLVRLAEVVPLRFDPASTLANQYENDEVPFNQLAISFDFRPEGVFFDSSYPKKIIAFFRNETVEYGVYLPDSSPREAVPYPKLVTALAMQPDVIPFWSPVYRRAINHLPVEH